MTAGEASLESAVVDVRYRLTFREVFLVVAEMNRCSKLAAFFGLFIVLIPAMSLSMGDWTGIVALLLGLSFVSGTLPATLAAWTFSRRREFMEFEWRTVIDADGIATWTPKSEGRAKWSMYRRIRETQTAFILDMGTGAGSFLPKSAFDAATSAAIASYAADAGLLVRGSTWRLPLIGVGIGLAIVVPILLLVAAGIIVFGPATG